jgi:hypothetical protein
LKTLTSWNDLAMKFRFTIGGLFLLTTVVAILLTIGLWLAQSPLFGAVFLYLLLYIGIFSLLYVFRYRRQIREARAAWREHQLARAKLHHVIASKRDSRTEQSIDLPYGDVS